MALAFQSFSVISHSSVYILVPGSIRAKTLRADQSNASAVAFRVRCNASNDTEPAASGSSCNRRTANYQPNSWDYCALQLQSTDTNCVDKANMTHIEILKEEVRHILYSETELVAQLELVDALQYLGLAYHFHEEIKNILGSIPIKNACTILAKDLHATSLLFRLLRENGFQISQDIFGVFNDNKGRFKECICEDPQGMLSLYEASHLAYDREETLDEARAFVTNHLKELKSYVGPQFKEKMERAFELPLHWRNPRLDVKWYIEQYEKEGILEPVLLHLAKLDFNTVQSIHQEQLNRMIRWWRNLGVAERLPFARDRLVECFFFAAGVVAEPKLGYCQEQITKVCTIITTLDDVYDIYGSLDELKIITDAVNKWDFSATEGFPEYLRVCYSLLFDTTNEIADNIRRRDGRDVLLFLKRAWTDLCNSFMVETKWQTTGYIPTLQEYLDNGWISASGHVLLTHVFCLSRPTEETIQILEDYPNFFRSSSIIFRLCNDLATSAAETARGDAPTSILCYMHEHGVTEDAAREEIKRLISNTWKKLNREVDDCSPFPRSLATAAINLARTAHCTYQKGDGVGAPNLEKRNQIKSAFLEPIIIKGEKYFQGLLDNKLVLGGS